MTGSRRQQARRWMPCAIGWLTVVVSCSSDERDERRACSNPLNMGFCVCDRDAPLVDPVPECSEATMGGAVVCCQGPDDCICGLFKCNVSTSSCQCTSVGAGNEPGPCTGQKCCASSGGTCDCSNLGISCSGDDVEVAECSATTALCGAGKTRVEKCKPM